MRIVAIIRLTTFYSPLIGFWQRIQPAEASCADQEMEFKLWGKI
jgi:hypothetical protein